MNLEITNRILKNETYRKELEKLKALEKDRVFCGHGIEHFLDVARIAMIICTEKGIDVMPDLIYSASLLHDIGRSREYTENIPHHIAGKETAEKILEEVECCEDMKKSILSLIINHRNQKNEKDTLENIFYIADKKSRLCFACESHDICNWSEDRKNLNIEV
ncbi:MAG: HD domain-containing protein [Ruminococcus flavefaciens]|nr:HD domain-containing protein [Ruminococcus flavefaciens]